MRALREGGDVERGDHVEVAGAAVGDDARGAADLGAQREHVADRAGAALAAGVDHEHLARADGVERHLLGVVAAALPGEQVGPERDEPEGAGAADHAGAGAVGVHALEEDVGVAALAQLHAERRDADGAEQVAQLVGELEGGLGLREPGGTGVAPRLDALAVVDLGCRPEVAERHVARGDGRDEAAGARRARGIRCVDLDLDDVAGHDDRGAGGRAREDDVARLERHELREVGDESAEREEERVARVLLHELAVHPGAHAQSGGVDRGRVDERRSRAG